MYKTTLNKYSWGVMLSNISSLDSIDIDFIEWGSGSRMNTMNWTATPPSAGTFYKPASLPIQRGVSAIPNNWTVIDKE
jgi:hypothetical protein